jgi:hypothetical protein
VCARVCVRVSVTGSCAAQVFLGILGVEILDARVDAKLPGLAHTARVQAAEAILAQLDNCAGRGSLITREETVAIIKILSNCSKVTSKCVCARARTCACVCATPE